MYLSQVHPRTTEQNKWNFAIDSALGWINICATPFFYLSPEVPDDFGKGIAIMKSSRIHFCFNAPFSAVVHRLLMPGLLLLMVLFAGRADAEKAGSADAFVDSVGVNVHLHSRDTPYGNFPAGAAGAQGFRSPPCSRRPDRHDLEGILRSAQSAGQGRHQGNFHYLPGPERAVVARLSAAHEGQFRRLRSPERI